MDNKFVVDWEYYNSHFPKISEEQFSRYVYQSQRLVLKRLPKDFNEYTESEQTNIKDCICNVLNFKSAAEASVNGVSSISNDGYSESYVQKTSDQISEDINSIIYEWIGDLVDFYVGF